VSWQLIFTQFCLRFGVKPWFTPTYNVKRLRAQFAHVMRFAHRASGAKVSEDQDGSLWVTPDTADTDKVLLYFHGGGYIYGSPRTHEGLLRRLAIQADLPIFAPSYPLAPENPAPAQYEAGLKAWTHLRNQGFASENVVIAGDSAGGGLALSILSAVLCKGERPAGTLVFSPWVDMALTGGSYKENAYRDTFLPAERMEDHVQLVAPGIDPKDPRISPLYASFPNCPPVMLHVSLSEILRDDSIAMCHRLEGFGAQTDIVTVSDAPHVWHLMDGWLPEAREGVQKAADFIQCRVIRNTRSGLCD
jgi:acetyl esterase/lipase